MSVFDVDYDELVKQLFPVRLRQPKSIAWLKCLAAPVKWLYGLFKANRDNNLYLLAHNSQICYMEAVLNDTFDSVARGIYIADPEFYDPDYMYLDIELRPLFIDMASEIGTGVIGPPDPMPLYLNSEVYGGGGNTFIVFVPAAIYGDPLFDLNRLKALADRYKLVGRNYNVAPY